MKQGDPFPDAIARALGPIARLMIARGIGFPMVSDLLKRIFVHVAERDFAVGGRRLTDSRVSLLTGLQRKDVKALRAEAKEAPEESGGANPLSRVVALWRSGPPFADACGQPLSLPKTASRGDASFESLAAHISRDVHPRTLLDELIRLGMVEHDPDRDEVSLVVSAFVPRADDSALADYFGDNLGDHAAAAVENVLAAPDSAPFFERAVHYNRLSPASLDELEVLARRLQEAALSDLNIRARELQERDQSDESAAGRFRAGSFVFRADNEENGT